MTTKIKDVLSELEYMAPKEFQETWDNSGLQVGDIYQDFHAALLCTDVTEATIKEAISKDANLIISHHPLIFGGLKNITGKSYVERVVIAAIKNNIVIYSAHTNMDKCMGGVSFKMAEKLGLQNVQILVPEHNWLYKVITYVPAANAESVRQSIWQSGGGSIGEYDKCSYNMRGAGTFRANESCNPYVGEIGSIHTEEEIRISVIVPKHCIQNVIVAIKETHPYEEPAIDIVRLENEYNHIGLGCVGDFSQYKDSREVLILLKTTFNASCIRHSAIVNKKIKRIALCGGSGIDFIDQAILSGADMYVTGDVKYHDFFKAENQIVIADIGHFESEQYTKEIFYEQLSKKFINFAFQIAESDINPVFYS